MGPILINCLLFSPESKQKLVEIGYVCPCIVLSGSSPLNYGSTAACIKTRSLWPLCFEAGCGGRLAREADSLPCQGARDSQVKLGVSGLHCLTALFPHWPCCQPTSPIGRASAPAQDFPAKEGRRHRWCQPCCRLPGCHIPAEKEDASSPFQLELELP